MERTPSTFRKLVNRLLKGISPKHMEIDQAPLPPLRQANLRIDQRLLERDHLLLERDLRPLEQDRHRPLRQVPDLRSLLLHAQQPQHQLPKHSTLHGKQQGSENREKQKVQRLPRSFSTSLVIIYINYEMHDMTFMDMCFGYILYQMRRKKDAARDRKGKGNLDQVGRVGVFLRSDKVLLDRSGGNEPVEDVDGTRLFHQLMP